ncbi:MAG: formate dehydrogenase accessory sulfurtransferase FdhD, partial [Pedosphaera parvula]|nr:formate dehydrogenase accessory sulfurtransferase FdhD [Pedosphaera parvula]
QDAELAAGWLFTESLVRERSDLLGLRHCTAAETAQAGNILNVFLSPGVELSPGRLQREGLIVSSCGLCGKDSIDAVHQHFPPIHAKVQVRAETVLGLPDKLRAAQSAFDRTGGLHAAGLFNRQGDLLFAREDIGRHNAVDKVIGRGFLDRLLPWAEHLLLVTGRASFEIMQKALAARIPVVCAVSAPSSLAVEFARESGQTLIGFLRGNRFNVYAGVERVASGG